MQWLYWLFLGDSKNFHNCSNIIHHHIPFLLLRQRCCCIGHRLRSDIYLKNKGIIREQPGRHACGSKAIRLHPPITAGTHPIRRKERSFDDEIYQHGPFVTIYCRLRRYLAGAHTPTAVGVQRATAVGGS